MYNLHIVHVYSTLQELRRMTYFSNKSINILGSVRSKEKKY